MQKISPCLIVLIFFFAGCGSSSQITEQDIQSRFQAAQSIKDNAERDNVLCSLAFEAAKSGMNESTEDIIKEIGRNDLRDSTYYKCALLFAKQGKTTEATGIAKSIKDNDLRDKTLAKIAEH